MFRRAALIGVILLAMAGCSDSDPPAPPTMTGTWDGSVSGNTVVITALEQSRQITGSGNLAGSAGSVAIHVTGTHVHPTVSLILGAQGFNEMNFTGTFVSGNELSGNIQGSGFSGQQLVLIRRQ